MPENADQNNSEYGHFSCSGKSGFFYLNIDKRTIISILLLFMAVVIWVKLFKNEPGKNCGRQPLKNLT